MNDIRVALPQTNQVTFHPKKKPGEDSASERPPHPGTVVQIIFIISSMSVVPPIFSVEQAVLYYTIYCIVSKKNVSEKLFCPSMI